MEPRQSKRQSARPKGSQQPADFSVEAYERSLGEGEPVVYVLRLYVSGMTPRSQRAIENIRQVCQEHLTGRYELEIIDIYQQPNLAKDEQIVAAPTLTKRLPPPLRKLIGDLSDPGRVLLALGLRRESS